MKFSKVFSVGLHMSEFYEFSNPVILDKKKLHKEIKNELYHCWCGITSGEYGGSCIDWKEVFYKELFKNGIITQTQKSIDCYGEFKID